MTTQPQRGWWKALFARRRRQPLRRRPPRPRLGLELFEDRVVPSSSIPLNHFGQVPQFVPVGPAPILGGAPGGLSASGRVAGIAVDPTNPDRVFVAAASGGIWRTTNATDPNGPTWVPLTDHLPASSFPAGLTTAQIDALRTLNMGAIAMAPSNPNILYAAEGEGDAGTSGHGVLKSTDGGNTWTLLGSNVFNGLSSHSIVVSNQDPNIVYMSVEGGPLKALGIWRTLDGGLTWTNITTGDPILGGVFAFTDVDVDPSNPDVVYASVGAAGGDVTNGIYRTFNARAAKPTWGILIGGSTQLPGSQTGDIVLAIAPSQVSTLYASIAQRGVNGTGNNLLGVYRSNDAGLNWVKLTQAPDYLGTQASYDNTIAVSPTDPNVLYLGGQTQCVLSTNANAADPTAVTFTDVSTIAGKGPHVDHHAAVFDSRGNVLDGDDGGIFRMSFNPSGAPAAWVSLNGNGAQNPTITALNTVQFNAVAIHPRDANIALGGAQDNGHSRFNDNVAWTEVDGGDGDRVIFDYDNPQHAVNVGPFISKGQNLIHISDDGGVTWANFQGGLTNLGANTTLFSHMPLSIDPTRSQRYFFGTDVVNISENGGVNWGTNYQYNPGINIAIPPTPSSNIPPSMGGPIPITAIAVGRTEDPTLNFPVIYAAHVDGTLYSLALFPPPAPAPATADWVDISPGGVVQQIVIDPATPAHPQTLYVIAGGAIQRSSDGGATWTDMTGDLPAGSISSIALDPRGDANSSADDVLYVGGGFGVYALADPAAATTGWQKVGGSSLPDVEVTDLQLNTTTGILAVATYGRGMWEIQVRGLIRGQVFQDTNGNGQQDKGEQAQPGVTVQLLNADTGRVLASTVTDAQGIYVFRSIVPGTATATNFKLVEIPPAGSVQTTTPPPVFANFNEQSTLDIADPTLPAGLVNFGNFVLGTVKGAKYQDFNENGAKDPDESGVAGFTIYIDANNNGQLDPGERSAVTAADGSYTFNNFPPDVVLGVKSGPYNLREIQQTGWRAVSPAAGGSVAVHIDSGQTKTGVDFGNVRIASIAGTKFEDSNGNGVRDDGEPGVAGWTIDLLDPADTSIILRQVTTDSDGNFTFRSLPPGTYLIREEVQPGWRQMTPDPAAITLGATQNVAGVTFGNFKLITVSGLKYNDLNGNGTRDSGDPGLAGWTFQLTNLGDNSVVSATTDASGAFAFTGVGPGTYRLREVPQPGWGPTTPNPADIVATSGKDVTGVEFGNFNQVVLTGTVFIDRNGNGVRDAGEPGAPGFVVALDLNSDGSIDQTATTAANGSYAFSGVGPGTHRVFQLPRNGFDVTAPAGGSYTVTLVSGQQVSGLDFGDFRRSVTVAAADAGGGPVVTVYDAATGAQMTTFNAYDASFRGGVRVAVGYFNADTTPDIVTAPGVGGGPDIRVFDGATGEMLFEFLAYAPNFFGGVNVATGDVDGDGQDDIITGAGQGGGPHVEAFSGKTGQLIRSFLAYAPSFTGGVNVAAGDVNGDGKADIITGAGEGGGPHVEAFSGADQSLLRSFFAYDPGFRGGVFVAAGDVNGDGIKDIVTGVGLGGGPHVRAFNGLTLAPLLSFLPFPSSTGISGPWTSGVRVASYDANADGFDDIIVAPGRGQKPQLLVIDSTNLTLLTTEAPFTQAFLGGVFVGGR